VYPENNTEVRPKILLPSGKLFTVRKEFSCHLSAPVRKKCLLSVSLPSGKVQTFLVSYIPVREDGDWLYGLAVWSQTPNPAPPKSSLTSGEQVREEKGERYG
jgi:hypothetical protein